LADNLTDLVGEAFRETVGDTGFQNDVDDTLGFVVLDGIVVAEGDALADTPIKQPVDVGDDDLFELTGLDQLSSGFGGFGRHAGDRMQRRCHV
jgi:hypothetical protein